MKKYFSIILSLLMVLVLCSCGTNSTNNGDDDSSSSVDAVTVSVDDSAYDGTTATGDFTITTEDGTYTESSGVYTISSAGTYSLSGSLEGYIYVNAGDDDEIVLELNGVNIESDVNSPIFIYNAGEVKIKSLKDTYNTITDSRDLKESDVETQGEGAIYAKCDLKLTGKGTLVVTGSYNNGVHTTKDLDVKNVNLKVTAAANALKGNNSVTIEEEPTILLIASGDGIKTSDSDVSTKGNQKGTVTITGGAIDIYAYEDGIDAAYDVVIEDGSYTNDDNEEVATSPVVNIYTNQYAGVDGTSSSSSSDTYYVRLSKSYSSYIVVLHFFTGEESDDSGEWVKATQVSTSSSSSSGFGGRSSSSTSYVYYTFDVPSDYSYFRPYLFVQGTSSYKASSAKYAAAEDGYSLNTQMNMVSLTVSNSALSVSWDSYSQTTSSYGGFGGMGMEQGNTNVAEGSAKGIKAANTITISGGTTTIKAYDDGIHANYGDALDNGSTGLGDVTISGGTVNVYASDDGIHADRYLNISGGTVTITYSYEGLEATVINISGGHTIVYSTDDGTNSSQKVSGITASTNVSGGILDVTVYGNDVDGIDSNGNYIQTGGTVITRGYGNGGLSTGMDCDGTVKVTGGILVCFGNKPETYNMIQTSSGVKTGSSSSTYSAKTYTIKSSSASVSTTNKYSYSGMYYWSYDGTLSVS